MRNFVQIEIENAEEFAAKLLFWSATFEHVSYLNSNHPQALGTYDLVVAVDAITQLRAEEKDNFLKLKKYIGTYKDWLFGHFSYDLKNETENLVSNNPDGIRFPELFFFQPRFLFLLRGNKMEVGYLAPFSTEQEVKICIQEVLSFNIPTHLVPLNQVDVQPRLTKDEYISKVNSIRENIHRGDIYEMNFCMEYFAEHVNINPEATYRELNAISQTPFSAFYRVANNYLASASPERFLKKAGTHLLSQPIKGTIRRGTSDASDQQLKEQLHQNEKDRTENVMVVDIVRNDLARSAERGSVKVDELYGIYSFRQVHQMISSISAELSPEIHFVDAIKNAFPMGSMTGAPKVKAMELIEEYETTKRGLYSGAVGYITPEGDFDFNVVIRSILYNQTNRYLSFMVGSAITSKSLPEEEYDECLLKAKAMLEVLHASHLISST